MVGCGTTFVAADFATSSRTISCCSARSWRGTSDPVGPPGEFLEVFDGFDGFDGVTLATGSCPLMSAAYVAPARDG